MRRRFANSCLKCKRGDRGSCPRLPPGCPKRRWRDRGACPPQLNCRDNTRRAAAGGHSRVEQLCAVYCAAVPAVPLWRVHAAGAIARCRCFFHCHVPIPQGEQIALGTAADADAEAGRPATATLAIAQKPWPTGLPEQIKAMADVLADSGSSLDLDGLAARFSNRGPWRERLPTILDALVALGRARTQDDGRWVDAGRWRYGEQAGPKKSWACCRLSYLSAIARLGVLGTVRVMRQPRAAPGASEVRRR